MAGPTGGIKQFDLHLFHVLPSLLTVAAVCAGLTSIKFGYEGKFEAAVGLVLAASVLDGLDGRLARLMKRETAVGAELDSLADFVNFGVAPVLILYSWGLQDLQSAGWIAVLIYAVCCAVRLARFNVSSRLENDDSSGDYFVGVPSPAGAILVLFPMVVSFAVSDLPLAPPGLVACHICLIGLLMICRVPTYSFKGAKIKRTNAKYALLLAAIVVVSLLTYLWATLTCLTIAYIGCLVWAYRSHRIAKKPKG